MFGNPAVRSCRIFCFINILHYNCNTNSNLRSYETCIEKVLCCHGFGGNVW